jgi:hypothetical protein
MLGGRYDPGPHPLRRGVRFRHFGTAVGCHGAVYAGKQLDMRDAAWGAEADQRARHLPSAELLVRCR